MHASQIARPGTAEDLDYVDIASPKAQSGQLLVRTRAIGVNFIDTYQRSGVYPVSYPFVPGLEGAGEVIAAGEGITNFKVGERVAWAESASGSYAEEVLVDASRALPIPDDLDDATAAALPLQGMTAHMLTQGVVALEPGQNVLLTGGAGGVGLLLTQMAAAAGARVISTVSTAQKEELARQAGAAEVIRYRELANLSEDLPRIVREKTRGVGVDVAYDGVGKDTFEASLASVRKRGMLVLFGGASGQVPPFDLQRLNRAGSLFITRPTLFHYVEDPDELRLRAGSVFAAARTGALKVRIGETFPLAEASKAHEALEAGRTSGKVVLVP